MHADHLGDCRAPAPNSILADSPADWMDSLMDSILDSVMERSSNSDEADQMGSLMDPLMERRSREKMSCLTSNCSSDEAEETAVRKTIKRKKKKLARKVPELTDSEEEEGKEAWGSKRKPASCNISCKTPALPTSLTKEEFPNLTQEKVQYLTKEEIPNLTQDKIQDSRRRREPPNLTDSSADEDEVSKGGPAVSSNLTKEDIPNLTQEKIPNLTQYSRPRQEPPILTDSSADEEEVSQGDPQFCGSMRGGAGLSLQEIFDMVDLIRLAILGHQPPLKLDELTPGEGNCFSEAIVQQCRRPPIKLYLQSRKIVISDMLDLKAKVANFVDENRTAKKLQDLRVNFEVSQLTMRNEGRRARTWREYWADMKRSGPWADDHFIQCTAWYLNVSLSIIYVGSETEGRTITTIDGEFSPSAPGERQPVMYLGYIVNAHYQSLLPQVEELPEWLAPPAIDNTLQRTLQRLQAMQGSQVSISQDKFFIKVAQVVNIFSSSLLQAQASVPISQDTSNQSSGNNQVRMDS